MFSFLLSVFVVVCFLLVVVVLMQSGRGGGLSGAFGGGGNQTVFGGRGAVDFLGKATWILGGSFMALALVLAIMSASGGSETKSLIEKREGAFPTTPLSPASGDPGAAAPSTGAPTSTGTDVPPTTPEAGSGGTEEPSPSDP